jgi:PqqD family protein of HPr-rel-A system
VKDGSELWSVPEDSDLRWRSWDGQFVAYHCASGDTHLLQPIAAAALRLLQRGPATSEALIRGVTTELHLEADPDLARQIQELLQRLSYLGLIDRVDCSEPTMAKQRPHD